MLIIGVKPASRDDEQNLKEYPEQDQG